MESLFAKPGVFLAYQAQAPFASGIAIKKTGSAENLPKPGPPQKVTEHNKHVFIRAAVKNWRKPLTELAQEITPNISVSTFRRVLATEGYHRCVARKVPYLTKQQKANCLHWACLYKGFKHSNWKKVIWSDESYIHLDNK